MQPKLFYNRPTNIRVRWATPQDLSSIVSIDRASHRYSWTRHRFDTQARADKVVGLVADVDGATVGYLMIKSTETLFRVLRMAVTPEYRRLGVATELLCFRFTHPGRRIIVDVREDDLPACLFLKARGFRACNTFEGMDTVERVTFYRFIRSSNVEETAGHAA